jgi:Zn-dependent protease with chaperone function
LTELVEQSRRRLDTSAFAAIAPVVALLPVWFIAIGLIWLPLKLTSDVSYFFFASMAMLFGVVLFSRPVQRLIFARMLGARPPTSRELLALQPAWNIVSQANHFSPNRFVLSVVDSDETNAFACGGHLLVVSSYAIDHLRQDQLTGVLAHELSHHMGGHTVALTVAQWMSLPIIGLAKLGIWIRNYAQRVTSKLTKQFVVARFFMHALTTFLTAISYLLLSGFSTAQALNNRIGRASEYRADARAAQMGFGHELVSALRNVDKHENQKGMRLRPVLSTSTHPPAGTRVAKLEALLKRDVAHKRRSIRRHQ